MKLKLYSAPTMSKAMELMRAEMGDAAVVLSAFEEDGRAEVRAAAERETAATPVADFGDSVDVSESVTAIADGDRRGPRRSSSFNGGAVRSHIHRVLDWHDVPDGCLKTIANASVRDKLASRDPQSALTLGLRTILDCAPLDSHPGCPILLFGPPGAGRTTVAARLARSFVSGTILVNADFRGTGNIARLRACSGRLLIANARSPERLLSMVDRYNASGNRVIIDGPSVNVLDPQQVSWLGQLIEALAVEPVLVMSAEGRGQDIEEAARAYAGLGAGQVVVTRLDMIRRLGAWIAAISMARLTLAQMSLSPLVSKALVDAHHGSLARLLLETAPISDIHQSDEDAPKLKGAA